MTQLFTNDRKILQVVIGIFIQLQGIEEQTDHHQRVSDFLGDLGCQGSQGGQSFALPQTLLGRKDPPIETGILNGDRTQVSQSPKDRPLIVIETMVPIHVKGEQTDRFLLVDDRVTSMECRFVLL